MPVVSQVVGNVGMYYAAYQLSLRAWNVMPTARNARGIDLLAYDTSGKHFHGIQVKALSRRNPVPLGTSIEKLMGDWWIIVTKIAAWEAERPDCFIMRPSEVQERAHRGERDGRVSYWLQPPQYTSNQFREAWDRIGRGDQVASELLSRSNIVSSPTLMDTRSARSQ